MKFKKFILLAISLLALATTASAQLLYKIEGNGTTPSYLFGTHHLVPFSTLRSYDLENRLDSVEKLVCEVDLGKQRSLEAIQELQGYVMAPADSTLSKVLKPEELTQVNETVMKYGPMPGVGVAQFDFVKPAALETTVVASMVARMIDGFDPQQQIDSHLQKIAKEKRKEIVEFETPEFQAWLMFESVPISLQAQELVRFCSDPEAEIENARILYGAYEQGDLMKLMTLAEEEPENGFMDKLLDKRNSRWINTLSQLLPQGSVFIAVGALHLPGEQGLIEGLRNLGYTVTPIR